MEQARLFIAIGISFAVFFLWSIFLAPKPPEKPAEEPQETAQAESDAKVVQPAAPASSTPTEVPAKQSPTPESLPAQPTQPAQPDMQQGRSISVETSLYQIVLSERGGAIKSVILKNFRETMAEDSAAKELINIKTRGGSALLSYKDARDYNIESAIFSVDQDQDAIKVTSDPRVVKFHHQTDNGIVIEKS